MATVIENFLVGIGIKPNTSSFAAIKGQFAGVTKVIGATVLAVKGAQAAFVGAVLGMANSLDSLSDAAGRVGTTVEELDKLNYIAEQTDSSAAAVEHSLMGIGRAAGNANAGMKEASDTFKRMGVSIKDSNGKLKDSTTLLYETGNAMKKLSKGEQLSLAQKLQLDPTIIGTITGDLEQLSREYETFSRVAGGSLENAAQASSDLMDEVGKMKTFGKMLTRSIMTEFIFKLRDGLIDLRKWAFDNADRIKKVVQTILGFIMRAGETLSSIFYQIGVLMRKAMDWWDDLSEASKDATQAIGGFVAGLWALNKALSLGPIGLFIAALTTLFVLYDDFATYLEGGQSLIDWGPWVDDINAIIQVVSDLWAELVRFVAWMLQNVDFSFILDSIKVVVKGIYTAFLGLKDILQGIFSFDPEQILNGIKLLVKSIGNVLLGLVDFVAGQARIIAKAILYAFGVDITPLIDTIASIVKTLIGTVSGVVDSILDFFKGLVMVIRGLFTGDLRAIFDGFGMMAKAVVNVVKNVFLGFVDMLQTAITFIGKLIGVDLSEVFESFRATFAGIFDFIGGLIDTVVNKFKGFLGWAERGINAIKRFFGAGQEETPNKDYRPPLHVPSGTSLADVWGTMPMSYGAATGSNVDNSSIEQKNDFNIRNEFHITGSGDPQDTANRIEMKQRDVARNMTSVVVPMPKHQSAMASAGGV